MCTLKATPRRPGSAPVCALLALLFLLLGAPQPAQADGFGKIFGTVAFQRPKDVFAPWLEVQSRNSASPIFGGGTQLKGGKTSSALLSEGGSLTGMQRLRFVNSFWNNYPYITDMKNWGRQDYWAIPREFVGKSGDCEDYAIVKFFTLRALGVPSTAMRIVVLKDVVRKLAHAVLAVEEGGEIYILDNISSAIVPHSRLTQYVPAYSLNEEKAWVHLKGRAK